MAAFATVEDFATYLRKDLDAADAASAAQVLDAATGIIKGYTRQTIEAVDNRVVTFRARSGVWLLPELPVRALDSITVDGTAFTDYDLDLARGIITRTDESWWSLDEVVVTYDSGYSAIPEDIQVVCVEVAKRAFENPAGLTRDDLNTASQWLGLTAENKAVLDRYRVMAMA